MPMTQLGFISTDFLPRTDGSVASISIGPRPVSNAGIYRHHAVSGQICFAGDVIAPVFVANPIRIRAILFTISDTIKPEFQCSAVVQSTNSTAVNGRCRQ
jgi:hypothetical protein